MQAIRMFLVLAFTSFLINLHAGEGMWLPHLLKQLNEAEMQSLGMKMTAEDIYSINNGSLKDAIVHFGGFCTAEVISDRGLILTNHHCGYSAIQTHSSVQDNFLKDGFWASDLTQEKPNDGLFATFIVRIEDVTEHVLDGTKKATNEERQSIIDKNLAAIRENWTMETYQDIMIRPFFKGNQYFLFVTETYNDVRLVGAPPESIGKFGADTDNWIWPRHTGDFSLFRIYAGPDNKPADYSPDNIPFTPRHSLPVSLDGVEEGDFTLVFGFPGRTNEYLPSYAIENIVDVLNPAKIQIRQEALDIMDKYMRTDEKVRLQYSSKFARIANYWKKWIGEKQGLEKSNAVAGKKAFEADMVKKMEDHRKWQKTYGELLPQFERWYTEIKPYALGRDAYNEVFNRNIDAFRVATIVRGMIRTYDNNGAEAFVKQAARDKGRIERIFKDYDKRIDQEVCGSLLYTYADLIEPKFVPAELNKEKLFKKGYTREKLGPALFAQSVLHKGPELLEICNNEPELFKTVMENDPMYQLYMSATQLYIDEISAPYNEIQSKIDGAMKLYMEAQMTIMSDHRFYPDANSTMRVTYGNVKGYSPSDAVYFSPVTSLDGVMEKYKPGDYEFDVHHKLIELYENKDYGQYASNGKLPVCFIGTNHTTGGNSGSPVIDANGNLIGLNFDRVWEGTMSDYNYDVDICRNIMVDIRYILFIVDKFAGASHLIEELNLVHPKS